MGKANSQNRIARKPKQPSQFDTHKNTEQEWSLDWFECSGRQHLIQEAMEDKSLIIVDAPSGCGKTTTVINKALKQLRSRTKYRIVYVKNPTECGDDKIGFLPGDTNEKLAPHAKSTIGVFQQFLSKGRLECMLKSVIDFEIPNFLQGVTITDSVLILDESQNMSPETIKLIAERAGDNTIVVVIGDSKQKYAVNKRQDGFKDLIEKVTMLEGGVRHVKNHLYKDIEYIRMETSNNMRSGLSRLITELYE